MPQNRVPITKRQPHGLLRKADKTSPVPVYDANGKLIGIVTDPNKITPIEDARPAKQPAQQQAQTSTAAEQVAKSTVIGLRKTMQVGSAPERTAASEALNALAILALRQAHQHPQRSTWMY